MLPDLRFPRMLGLPSAALGTVAALGLTLAAAPVEAATFQLIFTADAPNAPANDCSGAFGTAPDCIYNSQDDFYTNAPGGTVEIEQGGVAYTVPQPNLTASSYNSFDHGLLFSLAKVNFSEGPFCCQLIEDEGNFGGSVVNVGTEQDPQLQFQLADGAFFRFFSSPNPLDPEDDDIRIKTWEYYPGANPWAIFAFSVKGGPDFNVWEITEAPLFSGFEQSAVFCAPEGPGGECGVSHITFYGKQLAPIPLPAAGWLLLAGLGGLAMLRRRKPA